MVSADNHHLPETARCSPMQKRIVQLLCVIRRLHRVEDITRHDQGIGLLLLYLTKNPVKKELMVGAARDPTCREP